VKMVKRKSKKAVQEENPEMEDKCNCKYILIKIALVAFLLFLLTVWPWLNRVLLGVPWWVYLIIWVVLCGLAIGMKNKCWCCKK